MLPQNKRKWEKKLDFMHYPWKSCALCRDRYESDAATRLQWWSELLPLSSWSTFPLFIPSSSPFVWPLIQVCTVYIQGIFSRLVSQTTSLTLYIMIRIEFLVKSIPGHRREFFQCCKQGNYSLRRPPKLIIPQIFIEQRWATVIEFISV